ncbi:hypothetical protein [uncultured Tateyamaria sp.]|uniref:hypothetical protein n=1 Tax=Tateyamaria sp. 1078 TaxID=3417464 RepID=UPI00261EA1C6|nr:hypothetical protein [uncultured Tateyamaria sp.]
MTPAGLPPSAREMSTALQSSPAFRSLPPAQQQEMLGQAQKVFGYLEQGPNGAMARPMQGTQGGTAGGGGGGTAVNDPVRNMGEVAADTLNAIDFPSFVASLIQGTFQAIVDSSIQQMEAYSQLLASVSKTVDQFMDEHVTDDMARDHLADNYGGVFQRDLAGGSPTLKVAPPEASGGTQLPSFLQDLGFGDLGDIDEPALNETVIPQVRRTLAETRHQSLATIVMMGLQRTVVEDGEINAKMIFTVDATQSADVTFNDTSTTNWSMQGTAGRNPFGAAGVKVTTTNLNTQSEITARAELTGEVRIKFKTDYFPMERFADSQAIQLINNHAKPFPAEQAPAPVDPAAPTTPVSTGQALEAHPVAENAWSVPAPEELK